uniref:Uncharacterized protein n=1 Tax=Schlesneria paludicola TaxID=360056 RepID=A0A7C4LKE1_9PLAN
MRGCTMTIFAVSVSSVALLWSASSVWGQVESGPEVGKAIPALTVRPVKDGSAAEGVDVVEQRGDHATVYVFLPAHRFDRPAGRFVKGLDAAVQKLQVRHPTTGMVLVWMTDDADSGATRVAQIQGSLQLSATWTVFAGPAHGPEGWAINDKAAVTAVTARKRQVSARFGYDSVNETVVGEVERALEAAAEN